MPRAVTPPPDGEAALTELLQRLPAGPMAQTIRDEVARLRRLATVARRRPVSERARLLQAINDAEVDYLAARAEGSHQAADRCRRHKLDLEAKLAALDAPRPERVDAVVADPGSTRDRWLEVHLEEIERDLAYLRQTEQWSLIPPMDARAVALRNELDQIAAAAEQPDDRVTAEELRAAILALPHDLVDVAWTAIDERRGG